MNNIYSPRFFQENKNAIDIAFPVFAYEVEAYEPIDNQLDAYEKAALRFIQIGINSTKVIASSLFIQEPLLETVIQRLESKKYISARDKNNNRTITTDGVNALKGIFKQIYSENSKYGFMFVSACRKNVLPYFIEGSIDKLKLVDNNETTQIIDKRILINASESDTFIKPNIETYLFQEQYKAYIKNRVLLKKHNDGDISFEEAKESVCRDITSIDDIDFDGEELFDTMEDAEEKKAVGNCIRLLNTSPQKIYLRMRVVFNEKSRTGFRVESPFDFDDVDEEYFIRQIQWLMNNDNVFIGKEPIMDVFNNELFKLKGNKSFTFDSVNTELYIKAKMPLLYSNSYFEKIYNQLKDCLEMHTNSDIEKKAQIMEINSCVLEALLNNYIEYISERERNRIKHLAIDRISEVGEKVYMEEIYNWDKVSQSGIEKMLEIVLPSIKSLTYTFGKSIIQKLFNIIVINYYIKNRAIRNYVSSENFSRDIDIISKMNNVRILTGHDVKDRKFTEKDYDYYMDNLPSIVNNILNSQKEN